MKKNKVHTEETKEKISKALLNNNNAEKYTYEDSLKLFNEALEYSCDLEFDFIGEIAREQRITRNLYDHLISRFPDLKEIYNAIKTNLEANCYQNTKKNKINTAVGIINLKSNHKWTDRLETDNTNKNTNVNFNIKEVLKFKE